MKRNYNIYDFYDKSLYVVGDIHGNYDLFMTNINSLRFKKSVIVILGDLYLGVHKLDFYTKTFNKINNVLKSQNNTLLMFRGNHDDPSYFSQEKINFSNVKTIPDYSIIKMFDGDKKQSNVVLCVGGGSSIDRLDRIALEKSCGYQRRYYWEGELPKYDIGILDSFKKKVEIDTVLTHSAPSFCKPTKYGDIVYRYMVKDIDLDDTIQFERKTMDSIYNHLVKDGHPLKNWCYGHYHWHNEEVINNISFNLLNCIEREFDIKEIK